jgi:hypothetical protein
VGGRIAVYKGKGYEPQQQFMVFFKFCSFSMRMGVIFKDIKATLYQNPHMITCWPDPVQAERWLLGWLDQKTGDKAGFCFVCSWTVLTDSA